MVERRGEPAVVIMSVQDFIRTAAPPPGLAAESLERSQAARPRQADAGRYQRGDRRSPAGEEILRSASGEVIRAVVDANVFVSALISPSGNEVLIVQAIEQGLIKPYFAPEFLEEYARKC